MKKIAYLGIDYHIETVTIATIIEGQKDILDTKRIINKDRNIRNFLKKLSKEYVIKACYEASCNGYTFGRKMKDWGYDCEVIAPSLIPKKPGDKRKNDFRDAGTLAKGYKNGDLSVVHPPTEEEESIRNLIRCRLSLKEDEKRTKLKINSFLLKKGTRYSDSNWTVKHRNWLSSLSFPNKYDQQVLSEYLGQLDYLSTRIKHLDEEIVKISEMEVYRKSVKKLKAFKGIDTLSAMLLIAEITDFRRFPNPKALMAFLGLIPSESSSDGKQKGDTKITKTGNTRVRKQLIESVQHSMRKPVISYKMKHNLSEVDPESSNIAIKCMHRLHKRSMALIMKGKSRNKVKVAVAREFVGFIWAMMTEGEAKFVEETM